MTTKRIVRPAFGTTTRLGRRSFLRGSLGASAVCLGLPLLELLGFLRTRGIGQT